MSRRIVIPLPRILCAEARTESGQANSMHRTFGSILRAVFSCPNVTCLGPRRIPEASLAHALGAGMTRMRERRRASQAGSVPTYELIFLAETTFQYHAQKSFCRLSHFRLQTRTSCHSNCGQVVSLNLDSDCSRICIAECEIEQPRAIPLPPPIGGNEYGWTDGSIIGQLTDDKTDDVFFIMCKPCALIFGTNHKVEPALDRQQTTKPFARDKI
jgi:hypothetical protein